MAIKYKANKQNEASLAFNIFFKEFLKKSIWYWQNYCNSIPVKLYRLFFHKEKLNFSVPILSDSESHKNRLFGIYKLLHQIQTILQPGWICLSSSEVISKTPLALKAEGREEFDPTFDCKWKEAAPAAHAVTHSACQGLSRQRCRAKPDWCVTGVFLIVFEGKGGKRKSV